MFDSECEIETFCNGVLLGRSNRSKSLNAVKDSLQAGGDLLGDALCELRSAVYRREKGQTFTPHHTVAAIIQLAARREKQGPPYTTIIDPGCGSGRFSIAALQQFRNARVEAYDVDPLCIKILKTNAKLLGFDDRLDAHEASFFAFRCACRGRQLFIGNPPYIRHHEIEREQKKRLAEFYRGLELSKTGALSGYHIHFATHIMKTMREGDDAILITSAEWLDANYAAPFRAALTSAYAIGEIHLYDERQAVFPDAMTTGVVFSFSRSARKTAQRVEISSGLVAQTSCYKSARSLGRDALAQADRWRRLVEADANVVREGKRVGDTFRVSRGQVTGANHIWLVGPQTPALPDRFLRPCITRAAEIIAAAGRDGVIRTADVKARIIDLPPHLAALEAGEREQVEAFIEWAKARGAHESATARARKVWWSLAVREGAQLLATYMGRGKPSLVLNPDRLPFLNIAHGFHPRKPDEAIDFRSYLALIGKSISYSRGRTYAGGLKKFEPKDLEEILLFPAETASAAADAPSSSASNFVSSEWNRISDTAGSLANVTVPRPTIERRHESRRHINGDLSTSALAS